MIDAIKRKLVAISNNSFCNSNQLFLCLNVIIFFYILDPTGFRSYLNKMMFLLEVG